MATSRTVGTGMRVRGRRWRGFLLTLLTIGATYALARTVYRLPNPASLLLLPMIYAATDGGLSVGLASAVVTVVFLAHYFALPGALFSYDPATLERVILFAFSLPATALLVGLLKRRADRDADALRRQAVEEAALAERTRWMGMERDRNYWFRRMVETAEEGIWVLDEEARVTYVNDRLCGLLGYTSAEILGRQFFRLFDEESGAAAREIFARRRVGISERFDFPFRHKDGTVIWLMVSTSPMTDEEGRFMGALSMMTDITDRRRAEEATRRANEELERLVAQRTERVLELERHRAENEQLAATGRLAARIAHEINNPLAGIKNSFLLVSQAVPENHRYRTYVPKIEAEINRIGGIVRSMFSMYLPDQDRPGRFRAGDVAREIADLLEAASSRQGIEIRVKSDDPDLEVEFPEGPIRQILFNLLQNAIDASPPDSVIDLETTVSEGALVLTVRDRGPGIPPSDAERVYMPYYTTKVGLERSGLGLGLSVTRGLVELLKGTIGFKPNPGGGTEFRVELPLRREGGP